MTRKTVLLVEDNERMVELFSDAVRGWNEDAKAGGREFVPLVAHSLAEARQVIGEHRVDCALIDLRLPASANGADSADNGNSLGTEMLHKRGIPLAIISGYPTEAAETLTADGTVRAFTKEGDAYEDAIAWLAENWPMMEVLASVRARIEESTGDVFAKRIWPHWQEIVDAASEDVEVLATMVARQFAAYSAEFLGREGEDLWHPFEHYVIPSFYRDRAHTGDIFLIGNEKWIVLTPQCDMATGKVADVLLARCVDDVDGWHDHVSQLAGLTAQNVKLKASEALKALVNQNLPVSEHFLPPLPRTAVPMLVKFSTLQTMKREALSDLLDRRLASVASPFLNNLTQRFGAYISRAGQPNIAVEEFRE